MSKKKHVEEAPEAVPEEGEVPFENPIDSVYEDVADHVDNNGEKADEGESEEVSAEPAEEEKPEPVQDEYKPKFAPALDTLMGDVSAAILSWVRDMRKPYQQMSYSEQAGLIHNVEKLAEDIVKKTAQIVAEDGRPTILARVDQVTAKDGIKAVLSMSKLSPYRHDLLDAQGMDVLIVVTDAQRYEGGYGEMQPDAPRSGQPDLPFENDKPVFDGTGNGQDHSLESRDEPEIEEAAARPAEGQSIDDLLPSKEEEAAGSEEAAE